MIISFIEIGRSWGILSLTIAYFWQLYTLWILVQLHEAVPGKRYNRYVELAQAAFGETAFRIRTLIEKFNTVIYIIDDLYRKISWFVINVLEFYWCRLHG